MPILEDFALASETASLLSGAAIAGSAMFALGRRKNRKRDAVFPELHGRIDEGNDGTWRWGLRSDEVSVARSQVQGWHTKASATEAFEALFPGVPYVVIRKE